MSGKEILGIYTRFIKNISVHWYGRLGVLCTTSSFIAFLLFEAGRITGILRNTYIGLVAYLLFPSLFVLGLMLIPIGWHRRKKQTGKTTRQLLSEKFDAEELTGGVYGSRLFLKIGFFTLVNMVFLLFAGTRMLAYMDKPVFCGTACHSVMNPEWVTYQESPHSRVRCVDCHVGEGVDALFSSKLNGMWQILSLTFDLYERPIPTPVRQLRPARETCEKCHWPEKFYGDRLRTLVRFGWNASSTRDYTTLLLKIDSMGNSGRAGIHWHIAPRNEVRYASVNNEREIMLWVDVLQPDGGYRRYANTSAGMETGGKEPAAVRVLDCIDCHNRATHIYEDPQKALDARLNSGEIDRSLPYLKREALRAITNSYNDKDTGLSSIERHMFAFYGRNYPEIASAKKEDIQAAVRVLQDVYDRNIHPRMNIRWGSYPSFAGHENGSGCFRCHNDRMRNEKGEAIMDGCTACHSILAYDSEAPLQYLDRIPEKGRNKAMHRYLQEEFRDYYLRR